MVELASRTSCFLSSSPFFFPEEGSIKQLSKRVVLLFYNLDDGQIPEQLYILERSLEYRKMFSILMKVFKGKLMYQYERSREGTPHFLSVASTHDFSKKCYHCAATRECVIKKIIGRKPSARCNYRHCFMEGSAILQ